MPCNRLRMKNKPFSITVGILTAGLLVWAAAGFRHDLLVLNDGSAVAVGEVWGVGDKLFYRHNGEERWVEGAAVREMVHVTLSNPASLVTALVYHWQATGQWLSNPSAGPWTAAAGGLLMLCAIAAGGIWALRALRRRRHGPPPQAAVAQPAGPPAALLPRLAGFEDIESLFLNLFRLQLGASTHAPGQIETIEGGAGSRRVLQLKVQVGDNWRTRRMTLSPIGENTGSKSQCFYAIFDTHMVVKVPPTPVTDFNDYVGKLRAEATIMRKLAPKVCVIPNLSVICRKIHKMQDAGGTDDPQAEERYVAWLRENPGYQRYLMVNGSFVFFMDLARHMFLGHVLEELHRADDTLVDEIRADVDLLSDTYRFESKYGEPSGGLWSGLQAGLAQFRKEIDAAMVGSDVQVELSDYQTRTWFLARMSGHDPKAFSLQLPESLGRYLERRLQKFDGSFTETGRDYRKLVGDTVRGRLFDRNRLLMGEMAANLLALLAWLGEQEVALRDLKPDNLLVAGNPADYPHFLESARNYAIGLIDLETAVDYGAGNRPATLQPQLGGTPLYGTPSHFFTNDLLAKVHGDLAPVLHLQDWYAVIAILYEAIIGERLFQRTARKFPGLIQQVRQLLAGGGDLTHAYTVISSSFWACAEAEFADNLQAHAPSLAAVTAGVPEAVREPLAEHTAARLAAIDGGISACLDANPMFSRPPNRGRLEKAGVEELERLSAKYAEGEHRAVVVPLLAELTGLKRQREKWAKLDGLLREPFTALNAHDLLEAMFDRVRHAMMPPGRDMAAAVQPPEQEPACPEQDVEGLGYTVTVEL